MMYAFLAIAIGIVGMSLLLGELNHRRAREPRRVLTEDHRTAIHEIGHLVTALAKPNARVAAVSIVSDDQMVGRIWYHTVSNPTPDDLYSEVVLLFGGLVAELHFLGSVQTAGSKSDLEKALAIARRIPRRAPPWPLLEERGKGARRFYKTIPPDVADVLDQAYRRARFLVTSEPRFVELVRHLQERKVLRGPDLFALLGVRYADHIDFVGGNGLR